MKLYITVFNYCFAMLALAGIDHGNCFICLKTIEMKGIGSSAVAGFMREIGILFVANRSAHGIAIVFDYSSKGSGFGKQTIMTGTTGHVFGASEIALTTKEQEDDPSLVIIPFLAGALMVGYNIPGVDNLTLHIKDIAKIYNGDIKSWNDSRILIENPRLKSFPISIVARRDKSGSTESFTTTLSKVDETWRQRYGIFKSPNFTNGVCCESNSWGSFVNFFGDLASGIVCYVSVIPHSIGYTTIATTDSQTIGIATIINSVGEKTKPTTKFVKVAMDGALIQHPESLTHSLSSVPYKNAYPFSFVSYLIFHVHRNDAVSCCQLREFVAMIDWLQHQPDEVYEKYKMVGLSEIAKAKVQSLIRQIKCDGELVYSAYLETLQDSDNATVMIIGVVVGMVVGSAILGLATWFRRKHESRESQWLISSHNLTSSDPSLHQITSSSQPDLMGKFAFMDVGYLATVGQCFIGKHHDSFRPPMQWPHNTKVKLGLYTTTIRHENVLGLLGIVNGPIGRAVYEFSGKGTLHFVMSNNDHVMDDTVQFHFCLSVAKGMEYLHKKRIYSGSLSSVTCYVDHIRTLKIAHWERHTVMSDGTNDSGFFSNNVIVTNMNAISNEAITAIYAYPRTNAPLTTDICMLADLYSFALLVSEIYNRRVPFTSRHTTTDMINEIIHRKNVEGQFTVLSDGNKLSIPVNLHEIINVCCRSTSLLSINYSTILTTMEEANLAKTGIIESLLAKMESYTRHLEGQTAELGILTSKMEDLLNEVLPPSITTRLLKGETIEPESFGSVSILFIDIVGFTTISSQLSAANVMRLLNGLWTEFDFATSQHDTYKIDTIGDAYMVCSGLPGRNGSTHILHICKLALEFVRIVHDYRFELGIDHKLQIRLGINSGPVTAGIVGTKMPQYCVFGDAVNTAQRMESTSEPMRIQMSSTSAALFRNLLVHDQTGFTVTERGNIEIKGKGLMRTYWLTKNQSQAN